MRGDVSKWKTLIYEREPQLSGVKRAVRILRGYYISLLLIRGFEI